MEMETFKKFMLALDKRQKEVQERMFEQFEKDVVELIKLEKAKLNAVEAYHLQFAKVKDEIECPVCHKKAMLQWGKITCPVCGLSTGETNSTRELFRVWMGFCMIFDKNKDLAQMIRELQTLGARLTLEVQPEAPGEEIEE